MKRKICGIVAAGGAMLFTGVASAQSSLPDIGVDTATMVGDLATDYGVTYGLLYAVGFSLLILGVIFAKSGKFLRKS